MGAALETVHAFVSAAAVTTEQLLAAGSQQTLNIRASNGQAAIHLDNVWGQLTINGILSLRSPRMHDTTKGILTFVDTASPAPTCDEGFDQIVYSQDALTVAVTFPVAPGAASLQSVAFNLLYEDLPGITASLRSWSEVEPNIAEYVGVQTAPTTAAVTGSWGAGVALNSSFDTLKANQLYAVLGYTVSAACTAVALQGPDIGNLMVGGPGTVNQIDTRRWFVYHSMLSGKPYIPVINSANKANTLANVAANAAATQFTITWLMARLNA